MCGIVGYTGPREAGPILIEGLKRLEYRGYDSAGIALVDDAGDLFVEKRAGKLANLQTAIADRTPHAAIGLAHTRWATHGRPNDLNAHPHQDCTGEITVIHNGIIENFRELRDGLEARGHTPDVRDRHRGDRPPRRGGLRRATSPRPSGPRCASSRAPTRSSSCTAARATGSSARARTCRSSSASATARASSPRDVAAILAHTRPGHLPRGGRRRRPPAVGRRRSPTSTARPASASVTIIDWTLEAAEKGGYEHFMLKEIHEQPRGARARRSPAGCTRDGRIQVEELDRAGDDAPRRSTGSSSSPAAAPTTPRSSARPRSRTGPACRPARTSGSEFRYCPPPLDARTLVIAVTQSGETADTIAPTRLARERGCPVIAVTNTVGSAITRESDAVLFLQAGPEIAVAASKTFVTQVTTLVVLAAAIAKARGHARRRRRSWSSATALRALPGRGRSGRSSDAARRRDLARRYVNSRGFMFVGRGYDVPGGPRGRAQAQGGQLRPRRGLRGRRAQARADLAARRRVPARRGRDALVGLRQAHQQRHGGPRPRRPGDRRRDRGRRRRSSASRTTSAGCPTRTRRSAPSSRSSRSSCSPTTWPSRGARTSTSRATSPSP